MLKISFLLAASAWLAAPASAQSPATHQHSFSGAEQWAHVFDDPKRDEWQKPHEVIQALALKPDAVIADIGSGTGYFAVRLANMVPKGRVYGDLTVNYPVDKLSDQYITWDERYFFSNVDDNKVEDFAFAKDTEKLPRYGFWSR